LEDGHFRRVGGTTEHHADIRVIAATNKLLEEEQKAGRFREDLFYRLNVITISLPALKERRQDIPELVEHFLTTRQIGKERCQVSPEAMQALLRHEWPGNVRELANALERAQILAEDNVITVDDLPDSMSLGSLAPAEAPANPLDLRDVERRHVEQVLKQANNNKVSAAKMLGISRRALYRLIDKYELDGRRSEQPAS
jgi:DNA-binding NtrC family response regulator